MARQERDYYSLLGVGPNASAADIDRGYRRAARATHPDVHPDDGSAAERFRAVTLAYETLRDPVRRASYDRAHVRLKPVAGVPVVAPVQLGRRPRPEPLVADDFFAAFESLWRLLRSGFL